MTTGSAAAKMRATERIGRVFCGKWRIDGVIGVGGLAAVYSATHRAGRRVAIKVLAPEFSMVADLRARFIREAQVANHIGHPGVVPVLDDDVTEQGEAFLVMELLEGETLWDRRKRFCGRLDPIELLGHADAVLDVLVAAHAKGILHRDIKPDNLFLTTSGRLAVLDFGIARIRDTTDDSGTQVGLPMGTAGYMPPEQAAGRWEVVDERSDVWAVGATLFVLVDGTPVHGALNPSEMLVAAMMRHAPALRSRVPQAHEGLAAIVDRALAYAPEDRWPSAQAMQIAVREALAAAKGAVVAQPGPRAALASAPGAEAAHEPANVPELLDGRGRASFPVIPASAVSPANEPSRPTPHAAVPAPVLLEDEDVATRVADAATRVLGAREPRPTLPLDADASGAVPRAVAADARPAPPASPGEAPPRSEVPSLPDAPSTSAPLMSTQPQPQRAARTRVVTGILAASVVAGVLVGVVMVTIAGPGPAAAIPGAASQAPAETAAPAASPSAVEPASATATAPPAPPPPPPPASASASASVDPGPVAPRAAVAPAPRPQGNGKKRRESDDELLGFGKAKK